MKDWEVLEKAAAALEEIGWIQESEVVSPSPIAGIRSGGMCAIGGLRYAVGHVSWQTDSKGHPWLGYGENIYINDVTEDLPGAETLADYIKANDPKGLTDAINEYLSIDHPDDDRVCILRILANPLEVIPVWNDAEKRTADEVIDAMRHAAKFAKERDDAAA